MPCGSEGLQYAVSQLVGAVAPIEQDSAAHAVVSSFRQDTANLSANRHLETRVGGSTLKVEAIMYDASLRTDT
jgi:hypothetical protein